MRITSAEPITGTAPGVDPVRWAGWGGLGMLAAIVVNGPLATIRGLPEYWDPDSQLALGTYLGDPQGLRLAVVFFFVSTLIFVFGIPFFAGLRSVVRTRDASSVGAGVVTIGAALFFAGGLVSEVMSSGMATVVQAAPAYSLDPNAALAIQALQFAALIQGQVGLGVVMIAVSIAMWNGTFAPRFILALGLVAGFLDLLRPLVVTAPPVAIALFLPTFVWIGLISVCLIRTRTVSS